jgi:hypothetical protein
MWPESLAGVGAENYVTSCDLGIFVDQAAEPFSAQYANSRSFGGWAQRAVVG